MFLSLSFFNSYEVTGPLSPTRRAKLVKKLYKDGLRQTAIANLIGVSQATVSLDLNK
jgi:predicted transcriptional regulator